MVPLSVDDGICITMSDTAHLEMRSGVDLLKVDCGVLGMVASRAVLLVILAQ
jgi:hypothetical protein